MKLKGIDFGNILGASGVQGFYREGYWYHVPYSWFLRLSFAGMTFVAKTVTLNSNKGNMPLQDNYQPREYVPDCIKIKARRGLMLNAVGLSNPGLETMLKLSEWKMETQPFMISIMSLADTPEKRLDEFIRMAELINEHKGGFRSPFGIQVNLSCPNTEHDPRKLIAESAKVIDTLSQLGVPIMPKYSIATAPIEAIMELDQHSHCDAICVSNTLPFGWSGVDWKKVWGSNTSPLDKFGGGGLSGKHLRPLVCEWIKRLRDTGFSKPINGGGGIMSKRDVKLFNEAGASSVFIGSVVALRPWRVRSIIRTANYLSWEEN